MSNNETPLPLDSLREAFLPLGAAMHSITETKYSQDIYIHVCKTYSEYSWTGPGTYTEIKLCALVKVWHMETQDFLVPQNTMTASPF